MASLDIPCQIISLIEVTEDIIEAFGLIKDLSSLPVAFQETNKRLSLVEQILRDAKNPAKKLKSTDDAQAVQAALDGFDEKAKKLLAIFEKIGKYSKDEYNSSVYRGIIVKQGEKRVETLMDGILEDLGIMLANSVFIEDMQRQIEPLKKAREELSEVSPSLADSDLADQPGAAHQYGDNSRQYNLFGEGLQRIADGHYFEAQGNQNFGIVPSKMSTETE